MILEHLRLSHFRCYSQVEIKPSPKFNVIIGENGQGKTSLLEAIGLLAFLKSFRNAKNNEMLKLEESVGSIEGMVQNNGLQAQLSVHLWPQRKQARFNQKACRFLSEYIGKISAVSFSPSDLEIIRGRPELRRNWIDKICLIQDREYADLVGKYQKVLDHRNSILRIAAQGTGERSLSKDFDLWTDQLIDLGSKIIHKRVHSVDYSVDKIEKYYREISGQNTVVTIEYVSDLFTELPSGQWGSDKLELIPQAFKASLKKALPKELILGATQAGPHRDDLHILLGGNAIKGFGSQGETRSLVLAMRLAEVQFYKEIQGLNPILLIDDFSSELDKNRRKLLLEYLLESDSQVFLSTTEELNLGRTFKVREGRIIPDDDEYVSN